MSRTIDEKVVEMRFDNQDFERNVSQSMSTLDKLKKALNFEGAADSFSSISSAANKVNFNGVTDAIESVGEKFSWLETIATGALLKIGSDIESKLVNTLKSVTIDQVSAGFDKYADKTKAVQTIMAATGKEIGEVSEQLERLMWFTDETSYSFSDMVQNVGSFVSNGIDLSQAVTAMEGISNWAAISGKGKNEAGRAMYNLSQALAMGAVTVQDWKSVELAGMATEAFKKLAIEAGVAQGTLAEFHDDETGETFYATYTLSDPLDEFSEKIADVEVDWKTFRDTLKEKWFDDKVLVQVLNTYGEFTDKLNEAYNDINSQEGIEVTTSELIEMTNQYIDKTLDMEEAMKVTGKTAEELTAIFSELGKEEYAVGRESLSAAQEARTFQDAIEATQDAVSTQVMKSFELIFGNYEEAKILWTDLANELYDIFAGPLSSINQMLEAWRDSKIGGRDDLIEGFKNLYRAARSIIDPITEAWEAIFPSMTSKRLAEIVTRFKNFTESLILTEDRMEFLGAQFEKVFGAVRKVAVGIKSLISIGADFGKAFYSGVFGGIEGFLSGFGSIAENIGEYIENITYAVARIKSARNDYANGALEAYGYIQENEKRYGLLLAIADVLDRMKESLSVIGSLIGRFLDIGSYLDRYSEAGGGIVGVISVIYQRVVDVAYAVEDLVKIWTGKDISSWVDPIMAGFRKFEEAVKKVQEDGWLDKIKEDFLGIGTAFKETFGGIKDFFGPVTNAISNMWTNFGLGIAKILSDGANSIESFFAKLEAGIQSVQNFIRTNEALASIVDKVKNVISAVAYFVSEFYSLNRAVDAFREAGGGISGVIAIIGDKLRIVINLVTELISDVTGIDLSRIGDGINVIIGAVQGGFIKFLQALKDIRSAGLFGEIKKDFLGIGTAFKETFGGFKAFFGPIFDALGSILSDFGRGLSLIFGSGADSLEGFFKSFDTGLKSVQNFVRTNEILAAVVETIKSVIEVVSDFAARFLSLSDTIETFREAGGGISGVIAVIGEKIKIVIDSVADLIQKLTGLDLHGLGTIAEKVFGVISKVVGGAIDAVKNFFALFKKDNTRDFDNFGEETEKKFTPVRTFFEGIKKLFEGIWAGLSKLKPVFEAVLGKVGEVLGVIGTSLKDAFSNISIDGIFDFINKGLRVALGAGIVKFVHSLSNPLKKLDGIKEVLDGVKGCFEAWQKDLQAKTLLKLAAAIAIITVAVIALSGIDGAKLAASLGAIAAMFGELIGAMFLEDKAMGKADSKKLKSMATVMIEMSVAVLIMAAALKKLSSISWEELGSGLAGMTAIIAELTLAVIAMDKFGSAKSGSGMVMIEMAISLLLISSVLKKLSEIEWDSLKNALVAMTAAIAEFTLASIAMAKFGSAKSGSGVAMIEMALALLIVSSVLKKLSEIEWDSLKNALVAMTAAIAEFTLASIAMDKFGSAKSGSGLVMIEMALALLVVSGVLKKLSDIEWESLQNALVAMTAAIAELVLANIALEKFGSSGIASGLGMIEMATALVIMAGVLKKLSDIEWQSLQNALVAMTAAIAELVLANIALEKFGSSGIGAGIGMIEMSLALLIVANALQKIGQMSWSQIGKAILTMTVVLAEMTVALIALSASGPLAIVGAAAMIAIAGALAIMVPVLKGLGGMSMAEIGKSLLELAAVFAIIGVAGLVLGPISPLIIALAVAIALLGAGVAGVGAGLMLFAAAVELFSTASKDGIDMLIYAIKEIVELIPFLIEKVGEGILLIIELIGNNAVKIAETVVKVGSAILTAAAILIPELAATVVTIIDEVLKTLSEKLPSIIDSVATILLTVLNGIAEYLPKFIQAGIDIVLSLIEGLGDGLVENTERAKAAFTKLFKSIVESILILLGVDKGKAEEFVNIAGSMINGITSGIGEFAMNAIKKMLEFMTNIIDTIKGFFSDFKEKGGEIMTNIKDGIASKLESVKEKFKEIIQSILDGIKDIIAGAKNIGSDILENVKEGLTGGIGDVMNKAKEVGTAAINGVKDGATSAWNSVANATKKGATVLLDTVDGIFGIQSPSEEFEERGELIDEGGAIGLENGIPMLKDAAGDVGEAVLDKLGSYFTAENFNEISTEGMEGLCGGLTDYESIAEAYGGDVGEAAISGASEYLNADTGYTVTEDFVMNGIGQASLDYAEYSSECGGNIADSEVDGYLDTMSDRLSDLSDMTIQGPTITLVADTSDVDEAIDGLTHFHGETFDSHGELDAFLLAFDNMSSDRQLNFLTQYAEHGNTDMANYLQRRRKGLESTSYSDSLFYDTVQQTATEISQTQQTNNDNLMARLDETNANLLKIHEEIAAFHVMVGEFDDMQVVLDTGTLVGEMTPYIDEQLNNRRITGGRMVHA